MTEINSSFYRSHRPATYTRWADSVPESFRFSVKIPRTITHEHQLIDATPLLENFLAEATHLGDKLGCLLVQLPPRLAFDAEAGAHFFCDLRERFDGTVAVEPRHATWFASNADDVLIEHNIARVAADPVLVPGADVPGGSTGTVYFRLHGSPRTYYSAYTEEFLQQLAKRARTAESRGADVWCIFDNTAHGAATSNALRLTELASAPE